MKVEGRKKTLALPRLRDDLFAVVDADDARWKRIRVVAQSTSSAPTAVVKVLSIAPSTEPAPALAMPMHEVAMRFAPIVERIRSFGALAEGWDSYSAAPVDSAAIDGALNFLIVADAQSRARAQTMPFPFTAPTARGGVQFEWEFGDRVLVIEFVGATQIEAMREVDGEAIEGSVSQFAALNLVAWLMGRDST